MYHKVCVFLIFMFGAVMFVSCLMLLCVLFFELVKYLKQHMGRGSREKLMIFMSKVECNSNDIDMLDDRLKRLEKQMSELKSNHLDM